MPSFGPILVAALLVLQASATPVDLNEVNRELGNATATVPTRLDPALVHQQILGIRTTATPTSVPHVRALLKDIYGQSPGNSRAKVEKLIADGFTPKNMKNIHNAYGFDKFHSKNNVNPAPACPIYPNAGKEDAPYSIPESKLREVIVIPPTFKYGAVQPLIMVPGTGSTGYLTFKDNFIKQFTGSPFADPVWLNIPDFLLDDAQLNAEYVAYAVNYISCISNNSKVAVMAWSQGNLDTQWALKYWPSTRPKVIDHIAISPDYHGTKLAYLLCGLEDLIGGCPPAVLQQEYESKFIKTLRKDGGDDAYVPTTSIYSKTDEIVQPQFGPFASAIIKDARRVGVSNTNIQLTCFGDIDESIVTHEGVLYNGLAYALAVDALTHEGPGELKRINLKQACSFVSPGLGLEDVIGTEANLVVALITLLVYEPKRLIEPMIKKYAWFE